MGSAADIDVAGAFASGRVPRPVLPRHSSRPTTTLVFRSRNSHAFDIGVWANFGIEGTLATF
jgi:hypothetical protein